MNGLMQCSNSPTRSLPELLPARFSSRRRRVASENVVAILARLVAGEALCVQGLIAGVAVRKVGESPAAGGDVLFRVLDHELNVHGGAGKGRLEAEAGKPGGQGLVVKVRRFFIPMQRGNYCAIRERQSPIAEGLDRKIVAQFGAQLLELASRTGQLLARQSLDRDQAPVTIPVGDFNSIDRRGVSIGLSGCGPYEGGDTGDCCNCKCNQRYPCHNLLLTVGDRTLWVRVTVRLAQL